MEQYQIRVMEEKKELDAKIDKLAAFIKTAQFSELTDEHRGLLVQQLRAMRVYTDILGERVELFAAA